MTISPSNFLDNEANKGSSGPKIPTDEDLRSWISSLRDRNQKGINKEDDSSDKKKDNKDSDEEEDPAARINWVRVGLIVGGVLAGLYLISHEWATEISMQQFVSDLLSRDIVRDAFPSLSPVFNHALML